MRWLVACPIRRSSSASLRMLLHVHLKGDSGSPRVTGSINRSRSARSVASVSTVLLRPPPGRRMRLAPRSSGAFSWSRPEAIARRETPVARETLAMPPRPMAAASAAAASRRVRSLRNGASISNRALTSGSMAMPYSILPNPGFATLISWRHLTCGRFGLIDRGYVGPTHDNDARPARPSGTRLPKSQHPSRSLPRPPMSLKWDLRLRGRPRKTKSERPLKRSCVSSPGLSPGLVRLSHSRGYVSGRPHGAATSGLSQGPDAARLRPWGSPRTTSAASRAGRRA